MKNFIQKKNLSEMIFKKMIVKTDFWLTLISSRDNNNLTISKYSFPTAIFNGVSWKKLNFEII